MNKVKDKSKMKRGKQSAPNKVVLKNGPGLPKIMSVTLRAASTWNLAYDGTFRTMGFGCNTPFSPFQTYTTAEVPSYIGYLTLAYEQCYVRASRIRVETINSTVADSISIALGKDGNLSGSHTLNSIGEQNGGRTSVIGYFSGGSNRGILVSDFRPGKDMGIPVNSPDNICTGGNPPNPYFWILGLQSVAGGTGNVGFKVIVEYDLDFVQLVSPPPP